MTSPRQTIQAVTVYCSSSATLAPEYHDVAERFGRALAETGRSLIYGGGSVGLMGAVARQARAAGGHVTGIITERLRDAEMLDLDNQENIVVETMRERKALLENRGDAIVVLPGGVGTLEEFFEILVGRLLGEHAKTILVVDAPDPRHPEDIGYYQPLFDMFDHMIDSGFARNGIRDLFTVCRTPEQAIAELESLDPQPRGVAARRELMPGRAAE